MRYSGAASPPRRTSTFTDGRSSKNRHPAHASGYGSAAATTSGSAFTRLTAGAPDRDSCNRCRGAGLATARRALAGFRLRLMYALFPREEAHSFRYALRPGQGARRSPDIVPHGEGAEITRSQICDPQRRDHHCQKRQSLGRCRVPP
jgi:hypothetical protein